MRFGVYPRDGDKASRFTSLVKSMKKNRLQAQLLGEHPSLRTFCSVCQSVAVLDPLSSVTTMSSTQLHRIDLGRALCIITGASRGLGRTIAKQMSQLIKPGSVLVLVARSAEDLRALQAELTESEAGRAGLVVDCVVADLSQVEGLESVVKASKEAFSEDKDHILLFNNAGKEIHLCRFIAKTGPIFHFDKAARSPDCFML